MLRSLSTISLFVLHICFNENYSAVATVTNHVHELVFAPDPELPIYPVVYGLRVEGEPEDVIGYSSIGVVQVKSEVVVTIALFGNNLDHVTSVIFTHSKWNCSDISQEVTVTNSEGNRDTLVFDTSFPKSEEGLGPLQLCLKWDLGRGAENRTGITHEDTGDTRIQIDICAPPTHYYLPLPIQIIVIALLLTLAGIFSGLTLGLMSLDTNELEVLKTVGSPAEKHQAEVILPLRKTGNFLLCTFVWANVLVNTSTSILFDNLTGGVIALILSSTLIVIFGEILPMAICSRKGLAIGASTVWLTRFFMVLTAPLSWPIAKILDCVLGEEVGRVYDKEHLMELIKMSIQDDIASADEFKIVSGALGLSKKMVKDVMTPIDKVFMLSSDATFNAKLISDVTHSSFTRIPVYENDRNNIVALLNVKDLALFYPDDKLTVKTVCSYWRHTLRFVLDDTPLKVMLEEFKKGHYHLAMAQREVHSRFAVDKEPRYILTGIITLEDIIEEIMQTEISDEFDLTGDKDSSQKHNYLRLNNTSANLKMDGTYKHGSVNLQFQLAAVQWLSANLDPFQDSYISNIVLQHLVHDNIRHERPSEMPMHKGQEFKQLYTRNVPSNKFILILEGKVPVTIGKKNLIFEAGPFHCFGQEIIEKALELALQLIEGPSGPLEYVEQLVNQRAEALATFTGEMSFVPDFNAVVRQDITYLELDGRTYLEAYQASVMHKRRGSMTLSRIDTAPQSPSSNSKSQSSGKLHESMPNLRVDEDDGTFPYPDMKNNGIKPIVGCTEEEQKLLNKYIDD